VEDVASVATVSIHQQTLQIEFRMKDVNDSRVQHITSISGVSHSFFSKAWEFSCRKRNKQIREKSWEIFGLSAPPHFGSLLFRGWNSDLKQKVSCVDVGVREMSMRSCSLIAYAQRYVG